MAELALEQEMNGEKSSIWRITIAFLSIVLTLCCVTAYFRVNGTESFQNAWKGATAADTRKAANDLSNLTDSEREVVLDMRNKEVKSLYIRREETGWKVTLRLERKAADSIKK